MHAIEVMISCLEERKQTMFDILWHPLMLIAMWLKRFGSMWTCLLNAFKWRVAIFLNSFWFLVVYFIMQCHHIKYIPTNDEMYVMVALKGGNDDWKIPIDIFIVILTMWNDLEHGIDHCHQIGWMGGKWSGTWFLTTSLHTSWNNILSGPTSNFGTWAMLKLIRPNPQGLGCHIQKRK